MNSFRNHRLRDFAVPMSTNGLLNDIADAEFFQPRIQHLLQELSRSGKKFRDVVRLREKRFEPRRGVPFHYIEIGNLSSDGGIHSKVVMGEDAPSRATWIVQPGNVITSTVRPQPLPDGID